MAERDEAEVDAVVDRLLAAAASGDADAYASRFDANGAVMRSTLRGAPRD